MAEYSLVHWSDYLKGTGSEHKRKGTGMGPKINHFRVSLEPDQVHLLDRVLIRCDCFGLYPSGISVVTPAQA